MYYISTRNTTDRLTASQAILKGIADDGGLFVPEYFPTLQKSIAQLAEQSYQDVAFDVLSLFLTDFTHEELWHCIHGAYNTEKFTHDSIVSIKSIGNHHYLELFHGQTIAFKDMALSILPYFMGVSAKKQQQTKDILILTATSGDTGKAAMAGFSDVPNTKIIVFYPKGGVSHIQEMQMLTQAGENVHVTALNGNFDDAQTAVKQVFTDNDMIDAIGKYGYQFSSANSINIGRLLPQVVYYVYAYAQLIKTKQIQIDQPIDICVPTGNFGNILAAYYAQQIGIPIRRFICASNENNVLSDFFKTGTYNANRPFYITNSPSMDIVISSNLERLLYHMSGNDSAQIKQLMSDLTTTKRFTITEKMRHNLSPFIGEFATQQQTVQQIKQVYQTAQYVMDPHTAVADFVCHKVSHNDNYPIVIAATASPYKFPKSVMGAFDPQYLLQDDFVLVDTLQSHTNLPKPDTVTVAQQTAPRFNEVIDVSDIKVSILNKLQS